MHVQVHPEHVLRSSKRERERREKSRRAKAEAAWYQGEEKKKSEENTIYKNIEINGFEPSATRAHAESVDDWKTFYFLSSVFSCFCRCHDLSSRQERKLALAYVRSCSSLFFLGSSLIPPSFSTLHSRGWLTRLKIGGEFLTFHMRDVGNFWSDFFDCCNGLHTQQKAINSNSNHHHHYHVETTQQISN